jgi:hypothetical protein
MIISYIDSQMNMYILTFLARLPVTSLVLLSVVILVDFTDKILVPLY